MNQPRWSEPSVQFVTGTEVLSAAIILPLVCIALVGMRFYVRRRQETFLGIDDWLLAIGVLMITGMGVCFIIGQQLGVLGRPTPPAPSNPTAPDEYLQFLGSQNKIKFAIQILICFAHGLVKTSIICFSRRIFVRSTLSSFNLASWILVILAVAWSTTFLVLVWFSCGKNISLHWEPVQSIDLPGCEVSKPQEALVISDFLLDFLIIIHPIPSIWSLNMSWGKKLAVTGMFLIGLMSFAASTAQLVIYFLVLYRGPGLGIDMNEAITTMLWLSMVENSVATIASCLPMLTVLAKGPRVRNFSYRLSSGIGHSGWLPLWKANSGVGRRIQPSADNPDVASYAIESINFRDSRQIQIINQHLVLQKDDQSV
ncbi:hypothetical protein F5Y05DRAFT_424960 [Hypoxylon sp. FL0543]|nr:hypothetical protein F5Y05DRAFT_424960 [Hypoxylon sp. FL0543]